MNNVVVVQVVDGIENLSDCLGRVFFGKFALFADPIEQLAARGEFRDNVVFVLAGLD